MRVHFCYDSHGQRRHYNPVVDAMSEPIAAHLAESSYGETPDLDALNIRYHKDPYPQFDVLISHGIADKGWRDYHKVREFPYVVVSGPAWREKYINQGMPAEMILLGGYTKLDPLFQQQTERRPSERIRVLWAPTHSNRPSVSSYPRLKSVLARLPGRFEVVTSPHPRESKTVTTLPLIDADIVIADSGSTVYEAMALGKPVVFPDWLVKAGVLERGRGTFEQQIYAEGIGYHAANPRELEACLDRAAAEGLDARAERFIEGIFPRELRGRSGEVTARELERIAADAVTKRPKIDCYATQPHYIDHLAPVYQALGHMRGRFYVAAGLRDHAKARGIQATPQLPSGSRRVLVAGHQDLRALEPAATAVLMEHGAGQTYTGVNHPSYAGARGVAKRVEMFLAPNQHCADAHRQAAPKARIEVIGCPKLDRWLTQPVKPRSNPPIVAVSFHWDARHIAPEAGSTWPYYRDVLAAVARDHRWQLIGHGHPRIMDQIGPVYQRFGIPVERDFERVLEIADCYVTDNSSSLFEFAATDRPVVVLNAPWYRRNVDHGLRFWECAEIGVNCDTPDALANAIQSALEDTSEQQAKRKQAIDLVYPVNDGTASARAARAVAEAIYAPATPPITLRRRLRSLRQASVFDNHNEGDPEMGDIEMVARRSFLAEHGMVLRGRRFWTQERYAREYERRGLARRLAAKDPVSYQTKVVEPQTKPVEATLPSGPVAESEDEDADADQDIRHVGGGWYEVKGQRVRGRAEAEQIARGE